ncbi:MAG: RNA-binding cell elongation regulator Jag/EloR [Dehalococcoidia bacterium]
MANESVEVSAKSVDEAIDEALEELGLKRQQVEIEILTAGKPGLFGIGGEQARVRVTALEEGTARPMAEPEEEGMARRMAEPAMEGAEPAEIEIKDVASPEVDLASDHLSQLLAFMEIDGEVSVRSPETPGDGLGRASAVLDVNGDDLGLLIGRRGTTLAALQYMINLMVSRKMSSRVLISLDIEQYRRRREDSLTSLAQRMADRVRKSGRSLTLEPMPAGERRIVHLVLAEDSAVTTGSVGEGDGRKVVIYPQRGRPGGR